ncbi:hypothetical protein J1605_009635 [Eschrichtius robustus]|uniref:Uncharacterized protein n=1 Tax=Eschrichtius robustus TaxID=9764 RepID=A0AB34GV43_ESCRO|nr:hypothetical protein J1605_009635 [Eschrichtius robustus]
MGTEHLFSRLAEYSTPWFQRNIAEALVSKGLATVIRYRQDDDQRSSHYDELLAAEASGAVRKPHANPSEKAQNTCQIGMVAL